MTNIWIVVADEARAKILSTEKASGLPHAVDELISTEANMLNQELVSDKAGRSFDSAGQGRHGVGEKDDPKDQVAKRFAKEVGTYLDMKRQGGLYTKLIIVAAPRFLGKLRKSLTDGVSELVSLEIDKDLTKLGPQEIREHLPKYL